MSLTEIRNNVTQLCISGILRCIRSSVTTGSNVTNTFNPMTMNLEMLRYYWALSSGIEEIANIVVHNSRRLTTDIAYEEVERIGEITGSINASATLLAQSRTLNPAVYIVSEPSMTVHSQPNHLVAWTLSEAFQILSSARRSYKRLDTFEWFNKKITLLEQALRNEMLHDIVITPSGRRRPNGSTIRAASKARIPVYQKAIEVYDLLEGIERGAEEDIRMCLSQTLIANLEYWQRLELATALEAANSLSASTGSAVHLSFPFTSDRPIASVGPFQVYWQYTIPQRSRDQLDLNELWSRQVAQGIGVKSGDSRTDVAICINNHVISLFECKYFESKSSLSQAVLDASSQIVRYCRDLHPESVPDAGLLLSRSCIVVADRDSYNETLDRFDPALSTFDRRFIYFTDINGISKSKLRYWSDQLCTDSSTRTDSSADSDILEV
ncbi:Cl- channel voltage-gated family protein [Alicyclobacillus hesperidum URH17-3-68]|uniref:hypothetical protein n=1 Tax=Alicyclobacillus hesperidum TaxID=89784 RepID=UPI000281B866|nr:hypothetical protein [Alicyclobacillus hesperidum]EJY56433.1 Cl- channel voltage-gated family protein [Alicyclobacillus hesperidum URH17-3-68]